MPLNVQRWLSGLEDAITLGVRSGALPWLIAQVGLVALLFVVAHVAAGRLEPLLESQIRRIRSQPGLLRVVVAFLRRLRWLLLAVFLLVALALARAFAAMPPALLAAALSLSLAWFLAAGLSRAIRNRVVARTVSWGIWIYAALVILQVHDEAGRALDSVAISFGSARLSLLTIGRGLLLLAATLWLANVVGNTLDARVRGSEEFTPSMRVLFGKVLKIGLVVLAGSFALSYAGIDLTALTVLTGAVGVGIGFGLQKVISNFISGIIILADKSIKPGDTISVGETFGWIRELRARFVSVVTRDGREYLIPNEDFITERVVNWSFTDQFVRLDVKFGVSYDADPHRVSELAIAAAAAVPRVNGGRKPVCWITGFGESSVDFVLRFWIADPQQGLTNVRGQVFLALWDAFKANGVEIPYPVRNVVVRHAPPDSPPGASPACREPAGEA